MALPMQFYLWTPKLEFHIIVSYHDLLDLLQPLKNISCSESLSYTKTDGRPGSGLQNISIIPGVGEWMSDGPFAKVGTTRDSEQFVGEDKLLGP